MISQTSHQTADSTVLLMIATLHGLSEYGHVAKISQISAKLKPLMKFIDQDSGNSIQESQFRINGIHDPQFLWESKS